jgi:hypothetical protein
MFASKDTLLTRPSGYTIARSVRLRSSASAYLNRTPASAGNKKTWTYSAWVKYSVLDTGTYNQVILWASGAGGNAGVSFEQSPNTPHRLFVYNGGVQIETTQYFRDPSAWYHIVAVIDNTQATASNRTKLYVNGVQVTALTTANYPAQNADSGLNETTEHDIGKQTGQSRYFDGYLTEVNFIDGQALTPSSFGETDSITGVWKAKKYGGTYGTNGFYLNFSDNSNNTATTIGKDYSGNGNNWTPNNISVTAGSTYDSMTDVPTLTSATVANYCVLNPIWIGSGIATSNANLTATASSSANSLTLGTIAVSSGKWYWESTVVSGSSMWAIGIASTSIATPNYTSLSTGNSYAWNNTSTSYNGQTGTTYGATYTTGDVLGIALDLDAGTITFYKNNTSQGTAYTGVSGTFTPMALLNTSAINANFGQRPFTYTPPTGFVALNTYNLPASTIVKGNTVMDATLYTGNGSTQSITNTAGFKPDLVWIKTRSNAYSHNLCDSVRGVTKNLQSDSTAAEGSGTNGSTTAFNSNGFSVSSGVETGGNAVTYVGWQWQAGQGSSSSNTNGSITSTVSVNATAGFSVVTFAASGTSPVTLGHGLGVAPKMIIGRVRNNTANWYVYSASFSSQDYLVLNSTAAKATSSNIWDSAPTSTVFTVGNPQNGWNGGTAGSYNYVAYCWSEVAGFSKFGSYTGNGSSDGPFVYCGFRPKFVLVKDATTAGGYWEIHDSSRNTYNATTARLWPNVSSAEATGADIDFLSNGFKIRTTDGTVNNSGSTVIFAAFAEVPFRSALAR